MKLLQDILYKVSILEVHGSTHIAVSQVAVDSRQAGKLSCFIAVKGVETDGHRFINQAIEQGATAIVCEDLPENRPDHVTFVKVSDSRQATAIMATRFYGNPSSRVKLIGITGTNGKTTVATTLFNLFTEMGHKCGLLSTVRNKIGSEVLDATHTTPDAIALNALLAKMADAGCRYVFMEVSSHALDQKRVEGIHFKGAVFTNITHDHLDYHLTFDNYLAAKKKLFDMLDKDSFALVNGDEKHSRILVQNCKATVLMYSLRSISEFKGKIIENAPEGLWLHVDGTDMHAAFVGEFNAYNLLAVYGTAMLLKQAKLPVLTIMSALQPVEGRFQLVRSATGVMGIVDYAHTPDALLNVLETIREFSRGRSRIIAVVGCGGNRDKEKRPEMARVTARYAEKLILTSDNPRFEDPEEIIRDMKAGLDAAEQVKTLHITDRREAIRVAVSLAAHEDIILVAGKGHEKYQEIKGVKYPFDDVQELKTEFDNQTTNSRK